MFEVGLLKIAVALALAYCVVMLAMLLRQSLAFGARPIYAQPNGKASQGVSYAFFTGMLPWKKESVAKHIPTFVAGIFYHVAIAIGFMELLLAVFAPDTSPLPIRLQQLLLGIGLLSGLALLAKRIMLRKMRVISAADDYVANAAVNVFIGAALLSTFSTRFDPVLLIVALALLIYLPLGKIRHCVFFFCSRYFFGAFFGRRGVLPPQTSR